MAQVFPFQPYRYSPAAGPLEHLLTQPYDKISPDMQRRYLAASPYNLVRIELGERFDTDTDTHNIYTRAAAYLQDFIRQGILVKEPEPAFFAYFQEFTLPDSQQRLTRKGFIGLGAVEDYSAGVVHRHEQTLSGPKKDRRELLEHTRAHTGQIFMLYPDRQGSIDRILDEAAASSAPAAEVKDEYDTLHRLYKISHPDAIQHIQRHMADKKLLIADGHHRYETALAFLRDHPELEDARRVMMTFVNMYSPGLRILATHRVLNGVPNLNPDDFIQRAGQRFRAARLESLLALKQLWAEPAPEEIRIGVLFAQHPAPWLLSRERKGALDVAVLHEEILQGILDISPEAVREGKFIQYVRGVDSAADLLREGRGQVAFLLEPTTVEQVVETSFGGGVMPQKSTDFFPKLLSGLCIYKLEK